MSTVDPRAGSGASGRDERTALARAPGKINPWLAVLGKRPDGFHEIDTWMVAIDRYDEVRVTTTRVPGVSVSVGGPHASSDVPLDGRNLAARACAQVLARHAAAHAHGASMGAANTGAANTGSVATGSAAVPGLHVHVEKRVPSQAGLGGASSDAAAAWFAACAVTGLAPTDADAAADLAALGSDTVFFALAARTGAARCQGRGERVTPTSAPRGWSIALVTPSVGAPTADVYRELGMSLWGGGPMPTVPHVDWSSTPPHEGRNRLGNHLEAAALRAVPELAEWRRAFEAAGEGHFRLSGSGSSFFGLYETDELAQAALERIASSARGLGLRPRVLDVVHPAGHGARLLGIPRVSEDA